MISYRGRLILCVWRHKSDNIKCHLGLASARLVRDGRQLAALAPFDNHECAVDVIRPPNALQAIGDVSSRERAGTCLPPETEIWPSNENARGPLVGYDRQPAPNDRYACRTPAI